MPKEVQDTEASWGLSGQEATQQIHVNRRTHLILYPEDLLLLLELKSRHCISGLWLVMRGPKIERPLLTLARHAIENMGSSFPQSAVGYFTGYQTVQ